MHHTIAKVFSSVPKVKERRREERQTLVLRVGLLEYQGRSSFCLVKNISSKGAQVRLYASIESRTEVCLQISDGDTLDGRVAWVRGGVAGILFNSRLDPDMLLRVKEKAAPQRRRIAPRLPTAAAATFRIGDKTYAAELCDISTSGARIRSPGAIDQGNSAMLILPGLPSLRVFVRWASEGELGLIFQAPIPIQIITDWLGREPGADRHTEAA